MAEVPQFVKQFIRPPVPQQADVPLEARIDLPQQRRQTGGAVLRDAVVKLRLPLQFDRAVQQRIEHRTRLLRRRVGAVQIELLPPEIGPEPEEILLQRDHHQNFILFVEARQKSLLLPLRQSRLHRNGQMASVAEAEGEHRVRHRLQPVPV